MDADQLGVEGDGAAHLLGEAAERDLGVRQSRRPVKIGLQDELRGDAVARRACARAFAAPRLAQRLGRGVRREAFVAERDRKREAAPRAAARSGARVPSSRAGCRRRAIGSPTTSSAGPPFARRAPRWPRIASSLPRCRNGRQWMREAGMRFADRDADALRAEVEGENGPRRISGRLRCRPSRSGVSDRVGQPREIDAEQLHRRGQPQSRQARRRSRRDRRRR